MSSFTSPGSHRYNIPAIDAQDSQSWPKGRELKLSPLVPLVRRRVFNLLYGAWESLPTGDREAFLNMSIDGRDVIEPLLRLFAFLEKNGLLERFLANVLCPLESGEMDKDISEIEGFLSRNIELSEEVKIYWDFFTSPWAVETLRTLRSILDTTKKQQSQAETS